MGVTKTATKQTLPGENREGNQINTRAFEGLSRNNRDPQKCACGNTGVHHVGLYAKDPSASAKFYRDLLNMQIVGGSGPENPLGASAFLCSRPDEESHEIALFANPVYAHVAFKVSSLVELRSLHTRVVERGIPIKFAFDHGVSFAFYFDDPDGHMIEVYWPTGALQSYRQPYAEPLDLTQAADLLLEKVAHGSA